MISLRSTRLTLLFLFLFSDLAGKSIVAISPREDGHGMHRLHSRLLLELKGRKRAVSSPHLTRRFFHSIKRVLSDSRRRLESFDRHCVGAVVSAALHHRAGHDARDLPQQISSL